MHTLLTNGHLRAFTRVVVVPTLLFITFWIWASMDPWDIPASRETRKLFGGVVALGYAGAGLIWGRWAGIWFGLTGLCFVAMFRDPSPFYALFAPFIAAGLVAAVLVGTVGHKASIRFLSSGTKLATAVGAACVCLAGGAAAYFAYLDLRVVDVTPESPILLNERRPGIWAVKPRLSRAEAREILGGKPAKLTTDASTDTSLATIDPFCFSEYYTKNGVTYRPSGHHVVWLFTRDTRATTRSGVGVGDSLALVSQRYNDAFCREELEGSDLHGPTGIRCEVQIGRRALVVFHSDPIDWISVEDVSAR